MEPYGYNKRLQEAWYRTHNHDSTPALSRTSLFQMKRGKRSLESAGPRPTRRPVRQRLPTALGSTHTHLEAGADPRAPQLLARTASPTGLYPDKEQPKPLPTKLGKKRLQISRKKCFTNTIPIQSSWEASSPPRVAILNPQK